MLATIVDPQHCLSVGLHAGPVVKDIVGEVEVLWHVKLEGIAHAEALRLRDHLIEGAGADAV